MIESRRMSDMIVSIAAGHTPETTWLKPLSPEERETWPRLEADMDRIVAAGGYVTIADD